MTRIAAWLLPVLGLAALAPGNPVRADESSPVQLSGAYYLDSRAFTTAAVGISSNRLPLGFTLWGFTDFHGDHDDDSLALTRSFSEYRLSHAGVGRVTGISGLGFQAELNALSGSGNDLVRIGFTYRHDLPLPWLAGGGKTGWLQWRAFPYESDDDGGQASLIFNLPITDRVHVKGFADYNVVDAGDNRWVVEPELNVRISERLWALLEVRYNEYEDANPSVRGSGVAMGLRYQFRR